MKITFVNHASIVVELDDGMIRLLTDPWFVGGAFLSGWELMWEVPPVESWLTAPSHVWISHEHPDHFSPRTLLEHRDYLSGAVFLYQETRDKRVIDWLKKNGFKTQELPSGKIVRLATDTQVLCRRIGTGDSYLILSDGSTTLVNTNDSILLPSDLTVLKRDCGRFGGQKILTSQFGLAGKVGNVEDVAMRALESKKILELVQLQLAASNAKTFVPSASMKLFCKADNAYMNLGQTKLSDLHARVAKCGVTPVFLDSQVTWSVGDPPPDPSRLIQRFDEALSTPRPIAHKLEHHATLDRDSLKVCFESWWTRQVKYHSSFAIKVLCLLPRGLGISGLMVELSDSGDKFELTELVALKMSSRQVEPLVVDSHVLAQALRDDFGLMSLIISARFQAGEPAQRRLRLLAWVGAQTAAGQRISIPHLAKRLLRAVSFLRHRGQSL